MNGGRISFSAPASGASAVFSSTPALVAFEAASVTATANGTAGSYQVNVSAAGASASESFHLTNTPAPSAYSVYLPLVVKP